MTKHYSISKNLIMEAYRTVRKNAGAAGCDGKSIEKFDSKYKDELYVIWNRMSSGSYFPPPVRAVAIEKKDGGQRILGIPTVADRVAQTAVKMILEPALEQIFHPSSFGYRPKVSAHDAVAQARIKCWKYHWAIDLDVKGFFDNLDHGLMMKAVRKHVSDDWILKLIERWLTAPLLMPDGCTVSREKGTPQGGVISPLLANLFLHYAFDQWMQVTFPEVPFERYADDIIVHCKSEKQAHFVLNQVKSRLKTCRLEVHPVKTKIVRCFDSSGSKNTIGNFDFLGFTFRPRKALNRKGEIFANFLPAISSKASVSIKAKIREWKLHLRSGTPLEKLAREINPQVRGWIQYYGKFYKTEVIKLLWYLEQVLTRWAMRKFKKLKGKPTCAGRFLGRIAAMKPKLFAHWEIGAHSYAG